VTQFRYFENDVENVAKLKYLEKILEYVANFKYLWNTFAMWQTSGIWTRLRICAEVPTLGNDLWKCNRIQVLGNDGPTMCQKSNIWKGHKRSKIVFTKI
jgi:hypothetical protein